MKKLLTFLLLATCISFGAEAQVASIARTNKQNNWTAPQVFDSIVVTGVCTGCGGGGGFTNPFLNSLVVQPSATITPVLSLIAPDEEWPASPTVLMRMGNQSQYGIDFYLNGPNELMLASDYIYGGNVQPIIFDLWAPGTDNGVNQARLRFTYDGDSALINAWTYGTVPAEYKDLEVRAESGQLKLRSGNGDLFLGANNTYTLNLKTAGLVPASTNSLDVGASDSSFRSGYFGTSVATPSVSITEQLGPELLTLNTSGWTYTGAWTGGATQLSRTASAANLTATHAGLAAVVGTTYRVVWNTTALTAGSFQFSFGGVTLPIRYDAGTYVEYITATAVTAPVITVIATSAGTIETANLSIRAVVTSGLTTSDDMNLPLFGNSARLYVNDADDWFMLNVYSDKAGGNFRMHNFSHPTGDTAIPSGDNIFVGRNAGNFTLGHGATSASHGSLNIGIGLNALSGLTTIGFANVAIGADAGKALTTPSYNVLIGYGVGTSLTTGAQNVWMNPGGGSSHTTTTGTTYVGYASGAGWGGISASYSSAFGFEALGQSVQTGIRNTAIGSYALRGLTTSNDSTALGYLAGRYLADGSTANATPEDSTYIGTQTKSSAAGQSNETVIGYDAIGKGSNTVVIGDDNVTQVWMSEDGGATIIGKAAGSSAPTLAQAGDTTQGLNVIASGISYYAAASTNENFRIVDSGLYLQNDGVIAWSTSATNAFSASVSSISKHAFLGSSSKSLTDNSGTIFAKVAVASGSTWGGEVIYKLEGKDATDFTVITGKVSFSAINKAGTITCSVGSVSETTSLTSAGTSANNGFTCADAGSNVLNLLVNYTTSLTDTTNWPKIYHRLDSPDTVTYTPQ